MGRAYVFGKDEEANDYSSWGLVGELIPTECIFKEDGDGQNIITLKHPLDDFGRYTALEKGNIIVVPVPVKTTPEIQNGSCVTTVWTYKVKPLNQLTAKSQRTLYKKKTGSGKMKVMNAGDIVTVVQRFENENDRWKVKSKYGTGWINPDGFILVTEHVIDDNSKAIEEVQSPWKVTNQYFRIHEEDKNLTGVTVTARHIRYDLLKKTTRYKSEVSVPLQTALDGILNSCYSSHGFTAYTNVLNEQPGLNYKLRNPIDSFVNPENGICTKFDVHLISDNYDLYFLHDPGLNRGIKIVYRKNMLGIEFKSTDEEVATRIIPYGENKDGTELMLSDTIEAQYIDSPNLNLYPIIHEYPLKCDNCKVGGKEEGGGTTTVAIARARMRQQAEDLLAKGCDQPSITMGVDFINLGDTEEYKQFKDLENCFLFDYVTVQHPELNIDVTARIVGIEWDCLRDRMKKVTIGNVGKTLANAGITSWQVPSGFNGSKVGSGTLGNSAFKDDIISARHVQADSINTDALQAESITAQKIASGAIKADKLDAETVDAKIATISRAEIGNATIDGAQIREATITSAQIKDGEITKAKIGEAAIDYAKIVDLFNDRLFTDVGTAGEFRAGKLIIDRAQIVDLEVGAFRLVSSDGQVYKIDVDENGELTTEFLHDYEDWLVDGKIPEGYSATVPEFTVGNLTAGTLYVTGDASFMSIITKVLEADEGHIRRLVTSLIQSDLGAQLRLESNESIALMVGGLREEVSDLIGYRLEISSTSDIISDAIKTTTLTARVWHGSQDVTATIPVQRFKWKRVSADNTADNLWNAAHSGLKSIALSVLDVQYSATYSCELTDE